MADAVLIFSICAGYGFADRLGNHATGARAALRVLRRGPAPLRRQHGARHVHVEDRAQAGARGAVALAGHHDQPRRVHVGAVASAGWSGSATVTRGCSSAPRAWRCSWSSSPAWCGPTGRSERGRDRNRDGAKERFVAECAFLRRVVTLRFPTAISPESILRWDIVDSAGRRRRERAPRRGMRVSSPRRYPALPDRYIA